MKNMEADLEKNCMDLVLQFGGKHRKMDVGLGSKGQLDQHVWLPNGTQFDVEFKIDEANLSKLQHDKVTWLLLHKFLVFVVYDELQFRAVLHQLGM